MAFKRWLLRELDVYPDTAYLYRRSGMRGKILMLGTGGTIAGTASCQADLLGYTAAQIGIDALVEALPELAGMNLAFEQLAQLDSKDMDFATWDRLALRVQAALDDEAITGIVITHGTDTLEETAYLLHRLLDAHKPVVLTAAMRPASSLSADGPQNLLDAVLVAQSPGVRGVLVALQGAVHRADRVRKAQSYRLDAFESPDGGPIAWVESGSLRSLAAWPNEPSLGLASLSRPWPRVEVLFNAAGADGAVLPLLVELAQREGRALGIVAAGTGNGTLSKALETALRLAQSQGATVLRSTRCAAGPVLGGELPSAGALSTAQARVELLLRLR
jgi:L-asparaginase